MCEQGKIKPHVFFTLSRINLSETQIPRERMQIREAAGLPFAILVGIRIERWRHGEDGAGLRTQANSVRYPKYGHIHAQV